MHRRLLLMGFTFAFLVSFSLYSWGSDFQYEYLPFTKDQIYSVVVNADEGVAGDYYVVGQLTTRYTTTKDLTEVLSAEDSKKCMAVLDSLKIDRVNNFHVVKIEPINPMTLPPAGIIMAKFYRVTAVSEALRSKKEQVNTENWICRTFGQFCKHEGK